MPKYTVQEKQQTISRYDRGESATAICAATGIARSTLYAWLKDYQPVNDGSATITRKEAHKLKQHVAKLENIIEVLKKANCTCSAPLADKLDTLEGLYDQYSSYVLCEALDVPRSTFYNHIRNNKRSNSSYAKRREEMRLLIRQVYDEFNQIYGAKKIRAVLVSRGHRVSDRYVLELMQDMGLSSIRTTAKKDYEKKWAKKENRNVLQQQFTVDRPNKVWVSDITYFKYADSCHYICVIIDLFSRKVIAYRISASCSTQLVTSTFKQAVRERGTLHNDLLFHSDRGKQYMSYSFSKLLGESGVKHSLSAPGHPHDNAVAESFFSTMKREELYRREYRSDADFMDSVRRYIVFYNEKRPHTALNYKSPIQAEEMYAEPGKS